MSKKEFEGRLTTLIADHLSTMPLEEQRARLNSADRRLSKICRAARPTASRFPKPRRSVFQPEIATKNGEIILSGAFLILNHPYNFADLTANF